MRVAIPVSLVLILIAATSVPAEDDATRYARHLEERSPELRLVAVEREEAEPVRFTLVAEVAMPEPMWKLTVDSVATPDETGRIVVKLTGKRPEGSLPQAITWTKVRIPLGALRVDEYLVDVFVRASPRPHRRVGALSLRASS